MKKNIRLIIVISITVLILGISAAILLSLPESNDSGVKTTTSDILLYDKTSLDAEEITITNSSGEFTLWGFSYAEQASLAAAAASSGEEEDSQNSRNLRTVDGITPSDMKMHYTMQGYEDDDLSSSMTDVMAYQCSYVTAYKIVDKSGSKYADYGLEEPAATVSVTFSDNSQETLYIGSFAPDNAGIYFRRQGNANVYLTYYEAVDAFLTDKLDYFSRTMTTGLETEENIKEFSISGKSMAQPISITSQVARSSQSAYKMTSPKREICSSEMVDETAEALFNFVGTKVVAAQATAEDIEKFGLAEPYLEVSAEGEKGTSASLLISEKDQQETCYVMTKGGTLICRVPFSDVQKWYEAEDYMFFAKSLLYTALTELTSVEITTGGKTYSFDVKTETKENELFEIITTTETTLKGTNKNIYGMETYIRNLDNIQRGLYTENGEGFEEVYKAVLEFGDESLTDTVQILRKGEEYIISHNGNIECYADAAYIQALISQTDTLVQGSELEYLLPESSDEESTEAAESAESTETEESSETAESAAQSRTVG